MHRFNKKFAAGLVVATAVMPFLASAQTTDVQSQIQSLLSQIKALQQQLMTLVAANVGSLGGMMGSTTLPRMGEDRLPPGQIGKAVCVSLARDLRQGHRGEDVKKLQEMLAEDPGNGFQGAPTGFFGPKTAEAIKKFQQRMGIAPTADGRVGPLTRGLFERACGKGLGDDVMRRGEVTGTITAVTATSITVAGLGGNSRVVNVNASTTIEVLVTATSTPIAGTTADLTPGKTVKAEGPAGADGSIDARHIRIGIVLPQKPDDHGNDDRGRGGSDDR